MTPPGKYRRGIEKVRMRCRCPTPYAARANVFYSTPRGGSPGNGACPARASTPRYAALRACRELLPTVRTVRSCYQPSEQQRHENHGKTSWVRTVRTVRTVETHFAIRRRRLHLRKTFGCRSWLSRFMVARRRPLRRCSARGAARVRTTVRKQGHEKERENDTLRFADASGR
jgi:hypothetical protein